MPCTSDEAHAQAGEACGPVLYLRPSLKQRTSKRGEVCAAVGNQLHAALLAAASQAGESHGITVGAGDGRCAGRNSRWVGCRWDAPPHGGCSLQSQGASSV